VVKVDVAMMPRTVWPSFVVTVSVAVAIPAGEFSTLRTRQSL